MIINRNLKLFNNITFKNYSNINTETSKNDDNKREKNKLIFLRPRINLSFSKGKIKENKSNKYINMKQINIKTFSKNKKQKLKLLNISNNLNKEIKIEKNNIKLIGRRNFSFENIKPKKYKITENIDIKKRYMSKGELFEMIYGKIIKFGNKLDIDIEKNKRIKEILYNKPKFIIDLIEFGYIDEKEIKEFFNIESFNISWNENLEKSYREIRIINSNIFKIVSFLAKTGLLRKLRKNYESKNYVNFYSYNKKELEKMYDTYEQLKKYEYKKLKQAFDKVDDIYLIREILLKQKILNIRKKYFSNKFKNFEENKKLEVNIKKIAEKGKVELLEIKNCVFHVRQNINWKIFPHKKINRLKFSKSITKYNEIIQRENNIKNIEYRDKLKKEKIYLKEKIKILKKEKVFEHPEFNWNNFIKKNSENKRIIEYYIIMIQSNFRGFMVKLFLSKLIKGISNIIINLYEYTKFKQLILTIYKKAFEIIESFDITDIQNYYIKINQIKKVIKIMIKNCKTRKLIFKKNEVAIINKITEKNTYILPIRENQEIYSNIPLINLNKYLSYLNLK